MAPLSLSLSLSLPLSIYISLSSLVGTIMTYPDMQLRLCSCQMGLMGVFCSESATRDLNALLSLSGKHLFSGVPCLIHIGSACVDLFVPVTCLSTVLSNICNESSLGVYCSCLSELTHRF